MRFQSKWDYEREQKILQKSLPEQHKYFKRMFRWGIVGIIIAWLLAGGLVFLFSTNESKTVFYVMTFFVSVILFLSTIGIVFELVRFSKEIKRTKP
ncbi:MAG: hypothetical protein LBG88_02040 [Christensenellaceae bacterium]|jgi:tellurite resistance protein TehA-like permease|nr:hypothetical protein [Christensenellaceae bacterium]